jgi:hypothetical protein
MSRAATIALMLVLLVLPLGLLQAGEGSGADPAPPDPCAALRTEAEGWAERGLPWSAYGAVERDAIVAALCAGQLQPAYAAEGRPLCAVKSFREDPFVQRERVPLWPNRFHATTTEQTLLALARVPSEAAWTDGLRLDLARRMATPAILAVAVAAPVVSSSCDDGVDLLLVTRDMWSLRFIARPELDGDSLTRVTLGATENNLAGEHLQLAVVAYKDRDFWELGPVIQKRRIAGTMLAGGLSAAAIFTPGLDLEPGYRANAMLGLPVETAADSFGWSLSASAQDRLFAIYDGAEVAQFDNADTAELEATDAIWRSQSAAALFSTTFARGSAWRQLYTPYLSWSEASSELASTSDDTLRAAFKQQVLPDDERRVGPGLRWTLFEARYRSLQDYRLFGLSEELRDGPTLTLDASLSDPLLGATRATQDLSADLSWNGAPLGDDLLRLALGGALGFGDGLENTIGWTELRAVTPPKLAGRLHLRAGWIERGLNRARRYETVGGDQALRGFAPSALRSEGLLRANLEWRSRPLRSFVARVGGVLFVDAATARGDANSDDTLLSAGLGLRSFVPQAASFIWSVDLGFPLLTGGLVAQGEPMVHVRIDQAF